MKPLNLPMSFLGASKRFGALSLPVTAIELDHAVRSGAELRSLSPGMVPLYEEHIARLEANVRLNDWQAMDEVEKALIIAARRIRIALENLQAEAQIKASKVKGAKR